MTHAPGSGLHEMRGGPIRIVTSGAGPEECCIAVRRSEANVNVCEPRTSARQLLCSRSHISSLGHATSRSIGIRSKWICQRRGGYDVFVFQNHCVCRSRGGVREPGGTRRVASWLCISGAVSFASSHPTGTSGDVFGEAGFCVTLRLSVSSATLVSSHNLQPSSAAPLLERGEIGGGSQWAGRARATARAPAFSYHGRDRATRRCRMDACSSFVFGRDRPRARTVADVQFAYASGIVTGTTASVGDDVTSAGG